MTGSETDTAATADEPGPRWRCTWCDRAADTEITGPNIALRACPDHYNRALDLTDAPAQARSRTAR